MGLKNLNLDKKFVISMEQFILKYFGEEDVKALKFVKSLRHSDLKIHLLKVKCVPFETVDKYKVYTGEIVLVKDSEGHIAPYLNPLRYEMQLIKEEIKTKKIVEESKSSDEKELQNLDSVKDDTDKTTIVEKSDNYIELSDMSYSSLIELLKEHNNDSLYSVILKEIYNRSNMETHSSLKKDISNSKAKRKVKEKKMPYTYKKSYR